jgi:hypothetical protein
MQKLVYLIQETQGVPIGYEFTFYNHGPFSSDLAADLTYLDWVEAIDISFATGRPGGFVIKSGPKAAHTLAEAGGFVDRYSGEIGRVLTDFGAMTAKELELRATIVFVEKDYNRRGQGLDDESLALQVKELKPQFSPQEIASAIKELREKRYIESS